MTTPDRSAGIAFLAYRRTRSPEALAEVYDLTASRLLAVALHISSSPAAAEDAVQDTFLCALEHPERWDEARPLVPWLLGILGNRLKQSVHRARRTPDPARLKLLDPKDPVAELETSEVLTHIESAITRLAQPYRAVVLLRLRNGLSPADIAVALDRKPSTVRAQLTRGVEMLRKLLPVGVSAMLVGSLVTGRGLAAVRSSLVERALIEQVTFRTAARAEFLRHVGFALAGCAVVALGIWFTAPWFAATSKPLVPYESVVEVDGDPLVHARPVDLAAGGSTNTNIREGVATSGAVSVRVTSAGSNIRNATVMLEPLGDPPHAFVHSTSGASGQWSVTVPGRPAPESEHRRGITAADGRCVVEGLRSGHWLVHAAGVSGAVEIVPGVTADLELGTDARTVRGTVLDGAGATVAGASIWVCRAHVERLSREIAQTDEDGRFEVAVAADALIGARHAGHACVGVLVGGAKAPRSVDVVLRLTDPGARLTGQVVDERGEPVARAAVQIGHPADSMVQPVPVSPRVLSRPVRVTTDNAGRFACDGLMEGATWVVARAGGFGAGGQVVHLSSSAAAELTLTLPRAAAIRGTLLAGDGTPVVGASVQVRGSGGVADRATTTGDDGSYLLAGITPGRNLVVVNDHRGGFAARQLPVRPGEVVEWNPEFRAEGLLLRGRVLGRTGEPLGHGWIVHLSKVARTVHQLDGEGRFEVAVHERVGAVPTSVRVYTDNPFGLNGAGIGGQIAEAHDLVAGTLDVEIRVPARSESPAWLSGRFVDDIGALASSDVFLDAAIPGRAQHITLDNIDTQGRFTVGPLRPGRYTISVVGSSHRRFGPFLVQAGKEVDLGALRIAPQAARTGDARTGDARTFNVRMGFVWPRHITWSERVRVEIRDLDGRLFVVKAVPRTPGGLSTNYANMPVGTFVATATTESGLVATRQFEVDGNGQRRALLLPLAPE